jgi:hypothetical protein
MHSGARTDRTSTASFSHTSLGWDAEIKPSASICSVASSRISDDLLGEIFATFVEVFVGLPFA